jgi:hypothetical protein
MSKGRENSKQSRLRRRKVSLVIREKNLEHWNRSLSGGGHTDEQKAKLEGKAALATTEIATLKTRIGAGHHG